LVLIDITRILGIDSFSTAERFDALLLIFIS
jgi:hypothetical protein